MRVLLARAGALGDLLLLRRALAALRRAGHDVSLLAPAAGAVLVGRGGAEVDVHLRSDGQAGAALTSGARLPPGALRAALEACDLALCYTRSVELVHGLARVVGATVAFDPAPAAGAGHAAHWLARPLVRLGIDASLAPPDHAPGADDVRDAEPWLRRLPPRFLALHPGSGSTAKNWPFARFLELADALSPGEPWLLALGPAEDALVSPARLAEPALARAVVARELPLRTLAALFAQAGLFAGNDSGASHLAAACGTPTLALFGPTDPDVWAPVGPRVVTLRAPDGRIGALATGVVLDTARRLTGASRA